MSAAIRKIRHGAADIHIRQLQREGIVRLQKNTLRPPKALPHGAVGGLPEIAALGMLVAGASCNHGDAEIRHRTSGEHPDMLFLPEMRQNEALPVHRQVIRRAVGSELQSAAPRQRLHQKMHLRIMPQRLEMSYALNGGRNGFPVQNIPRREVQGKAVAIHHHPLQNLRLHLPHQADMHFLPLAVPVKVQLRKLIGQRLQAAIKLCRVRFLGLQLIIQYRLQARIPAGRFTAESVSGLQPLQIRDRHDRAGFGRIGGCIFRTAVETKLRHLFAVRKLRPYPELTAGNFHIGKPVSLGIPADLEHPRAEAGRIERNFHEAAKPLQKALYTVSLQSRTEKDRKQFPVQNHVPHVLRFQRAALQVFFHALLVTHGDAFLQAFRHGITSHLRKIHQRRPEVLLEVTQQGYFFSARLVHLVHKHKDRYMVARQQLPKGFGMPLHAVCAVDQEDRIVQHRQRLFHLRRKIHMPRCIQKRHLYIRQLQGRHLGENGDAAFLLHPVGIQVRVPLIHPAQLPYASGAVQHPFGQGGLARIHVGQHAQH